MRFPLPMPIPAAAFLSVAILGTVCGDDHEEARQLRERWDVLPLEELLNRSGLGADVRILEIESEFEHGRSVYEVEYVDGAGRIGRLHIDAGSGKVLTRKEDD